MNDEVGVWLISERKIPRAKKKEVEKALIPLPPAGSASDFYANPDVVQTNLRARRAVELCRGLVISSNAMF
jgi:hypothetical protein